MSGLVLAFDTSTDRCALAVGRIEGASVTVEIEADFDAPRAALSRLLPTVEDLFKRHAIKSADLSAVLVGKGPGSFTGVRIGVSTAKGLARGWDIPLYGVGSLDAIAWGSACGAGPLGVVGDAMRNEVYPALFQLDGAAASRVSEDRVAFPADVADEWVKQYPEDAFALAGSGLLKHAAHFESAFGGRLEVLAEEMWLPSGAGLLAAFEAALQAGEQGDGDAASVLPIYTRLSDAEETEKVRLGGSS